ncbi:MAG: EamA family transporter [Gallionellales bacterium 35-53-114]|jgi:drug/metabolite transporter (DMT)-like permease|nr:MAG: EamA family transporter [Gallionellales bacterium 35-53-114]OYZ62210.1 MAG: EamA family transporter [Gallionellales bacterium 24-53-125]OZB07269.1 MAG: EamA family transporter [Gallionellales bacterium 39-52-133]
MISHPGVLAALAAALLFGVATPLAKLLLASVSPWMLAGLLYLGSGIGLLIYRQVVGAPSVRLPPEERIWFAGAILAGGIIGPVLLMIGLTGTLASDAALLLNAEGVFTALLAWFVFKENFDRRIALGMAAIVAGALVLSWSGQARFGGIWPSLAILGACLAWGIDNNLTRKVALADASWIASVKGLVSGAVNLSLAFVLGAELPALPSVAAALLLGLFSYGLSLVMFVIGLRHLGTARTGAYFSVAPFFGALLALFMGDPLSIPLAVAGLLMALGVWLHLSEHHDHQHVHEPMTHTHEHVHDKHHLHTHDGKTPIGTPHSHPHVHEGITHSHLHFPDMHHRHTH